VYGDAQDEHKATFLSELVNIAKDNPYPVLIGEDFNILIFQQYKNNDRFDNYWLFLFNVVNNKYYLREVNMSSRQYTWENNKYYTKWQKTSFFS
jgi:hypothetical protein